MLPLPNRQKERGVRMSPTKRGNFESGTSIFGSHSRTTKSLRHRFNCPNDDSRAIDSLSEDNRCADDEGASMATHERHCLFNSSYSPDSFADLLPRDPFMMCSPPILHTFPHRGHWASEGHDVDVTACAAKMSLWYRPNFAARGRIKSNIWPNAQFERGLQHVQGAF